ncbi:aminoacyl-tRNA deacylase [Vibrio hippocampi]|uniref:Cys-tRNA(Pro)/Cys-tRNA(Cys) deacylase YbaK n=1 Tax=Vibrio hippocampi TaxID=654686 RepID=A0ABN8DHH0_9VIBR|nr:YbaK/EbsC family protein [Vibrio hippocampi]CAH0527158.1 Cys-tRNA(Pro)/Cys-tRNA(Cys) deacylase YbaK [Vibrio hippocampi]
MIDTPITRFLQLSNVPFRVLIQEREAVSIEDAAQLRGIKPQTMLKTMVLRDMDNQYVLACCPGDKQVDPKKVRTLLSRRRMTCLSSDEVEAITGYKIGTVTPLLLKQPLPIVLDLDIKRNHTITISSGERIAGIELPLEQLLSLITPVWGAITR